MINFFFEDVKDPGYALKSIDEWVSYIITTNSANVGELSYIFCSDDYLLDINKKYLQHDYYTDIITFDYTSNKLISGDLFISIDTIQSNSEKFNTSFKSEYFRVIIHGILHLLGYKDKSEEEQKIMRLKEDEALSLLPTFL